MRKISWFLFVSNLLFLSLAGWFYNGHYRFWQDPISTLGVTVTTAGQNNNPAAVIFGLNMLACAAGFALMARWLYQHRWRPFSVMLILGAIGFVFAAFSPDDLRHSTHVMGMSLGIGMVWLLLTTGFWIQRRQIDVEVYWRGQLAFQVPVISYAVIYASRVDNSAAPWQKIAMAGMTYSLIVLARVLDAHKEQAAGATG